MQSYFLTDRISQSCRAINISLTAFFPLC